MIAIFKNTLNPFLIEIPKIIKVFYLPTKKKNIGNDQNNPICLNIRQDTNRTHPRAQLSFKKFDTAKANNPSITQLYWKWPLSIKIRLGWSRKVRAVIELNSFVKEIIPGKSTVKSDNITVSLMNNTKL